MDMMNTVVEAVLISFFVGAIMGAIVAVHLSNKPQLARREKEFPAGELELKRVKVKARH